MKQSDDLWMAVATILPVLGLAFLVVARVQVRQMIDSRPALLLLGLFVIPSLLLLPVVEVISLVALAGYSVPDELVILALAVFAQLAAILFLVPALWLLRAALMPLDWPTRAVLWQLRGLLVQHRRLVSEHRKLSKQLVEGTAQRLGHAAGALDMIMERAEVLPQSAIDVVQDARQELISEASHLEIVAHEYQLDRESKRRSYKRSRELVRNMSREARAAASMIGWGVFSGSIGHEGAEQAREEAKRRAESIQKLIQDEIARDAAHSEPWTNLQYRRSSQTERNSTAAALDRIVQLAVHERGSIAADPE